MVQVRRRELNWEVEKIMIKLEMRRLLIKKRKVF